MKRNNTLSIALLVSALLMSAVAGAQDRRVQTNARTFAYKSTASVLPEVPSSPQRPPMAKAPTTAYEVPFLEEFKDSASFLRWTVIDANNDGSTWTYRDRNDETTALYHFNDNNNADDWLISPPIHLLKGHNYYLAAKAKGDSYYPERLEVKIGTSNTVAGMTSTVIGAMDINEDDYMTIENKTMTVDADGTYYLGFHALSLANMYNLYLDSISITTSVLSTAPDSVKSLKATANAEGLVEANISFIAPSKTIGGDNLSTLSRIVVKRDDETFKVLENPSAGQSYALTDNADEGLTNGSHTYTVIPYNGDGLGRAATISIYIGVDRPQAPIARTTVDNQTSTLLRWNTVPAKGANGGLVRPVDVDYNLYNYNGQIGDKIATVHAAGEYELTGQNNDEGEQTLNIYAINATNAAGTSDYGFLASITGAPLSLPVTESFSRKSTDIFGWISGRVGVDLSFSDDAKDGDGGALAFTATDQLGTASYTLGKIKLAGAENPTLVFWHKLSEGSTNDTVKVLTPDGKETVVGTFDPDTEWQQTTINLQEFRNERYIMVMFTNEIPDPGQTLLIDNINIADVKGRDLTVSLQAPASVPQGEPYEVKVSVKNVGSQPESSFSVHLMGTTPENYIDTTFTETSTIATFSEKIYNIRLNNSTVFNAKTAQLQATVTMDGDVNIDNNTANANVVLTEPIVAAPENVAVSNPWSPIITWSKPTYTAKRFDDDFESYEHGALEFGDWTTINNKPSTAESFALFPVHAYPHQGENFAFEIFNPETFVPGITAQNPTLAPHSGSQYVMAPTWVNNDIFSSADEYLVSPRLSGRAQTVSFYALNGKTAQHNYRETFEFMTSSTGNSKEDFTRQGDLQEVTSGEWTKFSFFIPMGTRYFAIHRNTDSTTCFMFCIDDAVFEAEGDDPAGYYVYRWNKRVSRVSPDGALLWNEPNVEPDGTQMTYSVSAIYPDGSESEQMYVFIITDIRDVLRDGEPADVYNLKGMKVASKVTSLNGLPKGIYIVNGKAVIKQ